MSTRKSCINFQIAQPSCFFHNSREIIPSYLIDSPERNEYDKGAVVAKKHYEKLLSRATDNYTRRTKQRLQVSMDKLLWESVVVLESHHTLEDVQKLIKHFEKKYGWQAIQSSLHRDEGYRDEITGEIVYNYHAHIVWLMLDERGIYRFKKRDFQKKDMARIQTEVAQILQMQRGVSKKKSGIERIPAKAYRQVAQKLYDLEFEVMRITGELESTMDAWLAEKEKRALTAVKIRELEQELHKTNLQNEDIDRSDIIRSSLKIV
jgi:hypothetical protein